MDLTKEFERRAARVQQLQNFVELYVQKTELIVGLGELGDQTNQVSELLAKCRATVEEFQNNKKRRYEQLIERARNAQTVMLNIMEKLDEEEDLEEQRQAEKLQKVESPKVNLPPTSSKNVSIEKRDNVNGIKVAKTPQKTILADTPCRLADYIQSPFTAKKMRPISLKFVDFDYKITEEEFSKLPSYMKGRETMRDIQGFLDDVVVASLTSKYMLVPKRKEAVAAKEVELWNLYKGQEAYCNGNFITQGDICRLINKQIDRKMNNRLTILKHLKVLQEERKSSAVVYRWNK